MRTPLEIIAGYGVSNTSYIRAIQEFNDPERPIVLNKQRYEQGIADIIGADTPPSYANEKEARLYFLYTVQETIRAFNSGVPDMEDVWSEVNVRAKALIERQPWAIKDYFTEATGSEPKLDAAGNPKKRKGAKKEEAEALYLELNDGKNDRAGIIAALMEEVGLSKPGATTYFHNLKKQYGFNGPAPEKKERKQKTITQRSSEKKEPKKRGPTKAQLAREIYSEMAGQDKAAIIAAIVERTGTSKAGANTYYCACKKELGT